MTIVALGSVKSSPGVTTTVLALAAVWPTSRGLVVAELDPDGGVLAVRRELALEPGLVTLATTLRRGGDATAHTQPLGANVRAIVAPPSAEQTLVALGVAGDRLWQALDTLGDDLLVDCGRLTTTSPVIPIARRAAMTFVVARPRLEDVALLRERIPALRRQRVDPRVLLVGHGRFHPDEVAAAVDTSVAAVIPVDRRSADALDSRTAGRLTSRAPLLRCARQISATLVPRGGSGTEAQA